MKNIRPTTSMAEVCLGEYAKMMMEVSKATIERRKTVLKIAAFRNFFGNGTERDLLWIDSFLFFGDDMVD